MTDYTGYRLAPPPNDGEEAACVATGPEYDPFPGTRRAQATVLRRL
ncbi:hypothetical protein GCM10027403_05820 [Arthrobacter tecti]